MQLKTIAFAALLTAASGRGATYWVSTGGNDSNAGSPGAPFRHLSHAAAMASHPGDTVVVMNGTYDNEGVVAPDFVVNLQYSGTLGNPISFIAQYRGQAILDSMNTSPGTACNGASSYFNLGNAAYIVIQGFVIQHACDQGIQSNGNAHDITLRWNEFCYIANRTITDEIGRDGIYMTASQYNFTFDGNIWHDIGRTDGTPSLEYDHGIYSHGQNVKITNNLFYNMHSGWSIQLADGASNWLIANNTFAFGNAGGLTGQIMFWQQNSGITLQNNIFYQPNIAALKQYQAVISNSVFESNVVYGVTSLGSVPGLLFGSNLIGQNPMFVNASTPPYNFELQPGSPAIGSGVSSTVATDFAGRTRLRSSADVGAFERQ